MFSHLDVSVIIPVYNAEQFIAKAVDSVLQFPEVKEVLLIDDGSKDHSFEICKELSEKYSIVKALQHPDKKNHGVSATRNLGIDLATQEFITFLDADDYWLPNRFDYDREYFKYPKIDGVFGTICTEFVTEEGKRQYLEKFGGNGLTGVFYEAEGMDVFYGLTEKNKGFGTFFSMIALTIKKKSLENPKIRLNEELRISEDNDFINRIAYHAYLKAAPVNIPIAVRTGHENNNITKIKNHSTEFFHHRSLLFKSLYQWGKKTKIPKDILEIFKYKYLYMKVASETGIKKYFNFVRYAIINPKLLKTRYRYYALKNNKI